MGIRYHSFGSSIGVAATIQNQDQQTWDATISIDDSIPPNFESFDTNFTVLKTSTFTLTDDNVDLWKSSNNLFFSSSTIAKPTYDSQNQLFPLRFSASRLEYSGSISDFNFLHDGTSDYTMIMVASLSRSGSGTQMLVGEGSTGGATRGITCFVNGIGFKNSFQYFIGNGSVGQGIQTPSNSSYWFSEARVEGPHIFIVRYLSSSKLITTRIGGAEVSATLTLTPSNLNPSYPLTLGSRSDFLVSYLSGAISVFSIKKSYLSDEQCSEIELWANDKFEAVISDSD